MRIFLYEIVHAKSRQDGKPLTRIYISAKPRFSHREMFSKQEQVLEKITDADCPFDNAFQIAVTRDMSVSSLCVAKIDLNRLEKKLSLSFVHNLEIVVFDPLDTKKFIQWLATLWKGEWKEHKEK